MQSSFATALSVSRVSQPHCSILQLTAPNGRCCSYPICCFSYQVPYPRLLPCLTLLLSDFLLHPRERVLLTGLLATRTYSYYTLPFLQVKLFLESESLEVETSPAPSSTQSTTPTGETFSGIGFCVKLSNILTAQKTKSTREPSPPSLFFSTN